MLPRDHCRLLQTNSIWQSDQEVDKCSLVERILHLDPLEVPTSSLFLTCNLSISTSWYFTNMRFFLSCLVAEYLQGYHSTWCSHLWQSFRWSIYGTGIWVYLHFEFAYVAPSLSIQAISKSPPLTKISQALAAASKTVDFRKIVHSFHSYFLLVGDIDSMNQPLIPLPPSKYAFFFSLNSHLIISFVCYSWQSPLYIKFIVYVMGTTLPPEE